MFSMILSIILVLFSTLFFVNAVNNDFEQRKSNDLTLIKKLKNDIKAIKDEIEIQSLLKNKNLNEIHQLKKRRENIITQENEQFGKFCNEIDIKTKTILESEKKIAKNSYTSIFNKELLEIICNNIGGKK